MQFSNARAPEGALQRNKAMTMSAGGRRPRSSCSLKRKVIKPACCRVASCISDYNLHTISTTQQL